MKNLENKTTTLADGADGFATYKDFILICLNTPPQEGYTRDEMKALDRIEMALDEANGTINLEDSDAAKLKEVVNRTTWRTRHKDLTAFLDAVNDL